MPIYRPEDVAARCGAALEKVEQVPARTVRDALRGEMDDALLDVATGEPAAYWRCRGRYFLDDPSFGPVADFADLRYSPELGLYDAHTERR
ncbi:MAG TPA: hypothetical protein VFL91_06420 [Thermomicrobiales bacterium]|nr:hypothetical protein [Thermomicrobiales bacterium]